MWGDQMIIFGGAMKYQAAANYRGGIE